MGPRRQEPTGEEIVAVAEQLHIIALRGAARGKIPRERARGIAQETLFRMLNGEVRLEPGTSLLRVGIRVMWNISVDGTRKRLRMRAGEFDLDTLASEPAPAPDEPQPQPPSQPLPDLSRVFERHASKLTPVQRQVFGLQSEVQCFAEVARRLGKRSASSVTKAYTRAVRRLALIAKQEEETGPGGESDPTNDR